MNYVPLLEKDLTNVYRNDTSSYLYSIHLFPPNALSPEVEIPQSPQNLLKQYGPLHVVLTLATHQKRNDLYYHPLSVMSYPVFHVTEFVPPSTTVHVLESRKYPL